jgi:hypothetical protein
MTIHIVGVYKAYKNLGNARCHSKKTKKHWKHYFIDDEEDENNFQTEWVSSLKAIILKRKQLSKKRFQCEQCEKIWEAYVPKKQTEIECTECEEEF